MLEDTGTEAKKLWADNKELRFELNEVKGVAEQLDQEVTLLRPEMEKMLPENERLQKSVTEIRRKFEETQEMNRKLGRDMQATKGK